MLVSDPEVRTPELENCTWSVKEIMLPGEEALLYRAATCGGVETTLARWRCVDATFAADPQIMLMNDGLDIRAMPSGEGAYDCPTVVSSLHPHLGSARLD